jgi:hypothetical protein
MIATVATAIKDHIVSNLPWAERVGGLAIVAKQPIMTTIEGEQRKTGENLFPITNDLEGRTCWESGRYFDLLPGSAYKSVIYFEQLREVRFSDDLLQVDKFRRFSWTGQIRLVCWLNLKKFGWENTGLADLCLADLVSIILANERKVPFGRIVVDNEMFTNAYLDIRIGGEPIRDGNVIFSRYSVSEVANNLLYPFEFFALDLDFIFSVGRNCITKPEILTELC